MDNEKYIELIDLYLSDELDKEQRAEFEYLFSTSESFRNLLEEQKKLNEILSSISFDSPDFVSPAIEKIKKEQTKKNRTKKVLRITSSVAAALIVFTFAAAALPLILSPSANKSESSAMDYSDSKEIVNQPEESLEEFDYTEPIVGAEGIYEGEGASGEYLSTYYLSDSDFSSLADEIYKKYPEDIIFDGDSFEYQHSALITLTEDNIDDVSSLVLKYLPEFASSPGEEIRILGES